MRQHENPEPAPDISQVGYKQELKRSLSLRDLIVYGLIFMVPITPFGIYASSWPSRGAWSP